MLLNREGRFHAYPAAIGLGESSSGLAQVVIDYAIVEEIVNGENHDVSAEGLRLTGYHFLEKSDGTLNTRTINALKEALGWDGVNPLWLQDTDLSDHPVQIVCEFETYEGKQRIRVQWLNPYGSAGGGGGVTKADDATARSIMNRLGAKLRASAGGAGVKAPAPAGAPAIPAAPAPAPAPQAAPKSPAPPAASPAHQPAATQQSAWEAFCSALGGYNWPQEEVEKEWFRVLAELFPGRTSFADLTPAEWARMQDEGPGKIIPL